MSRYYWVLWERKQEPLAGSANLGNKIRPAGANPEFDSSSRGKGLIHRPANVHQSVTPALHKPLVAGPKTSHTTVIWVRNIDDKVSILVS